MDHSIESEGNKVTDFMTDLIPYRCPKCGDRRRFSTLRELKHHLEADHSFKTACIRPAVFRRNGKTWSKTEKANSNEYVIKTERVFRKHQDRSGGDDSELNHTTERMSPLLQSYKDDAAILELELQLSKQNEVRNKTENLRALSGNAINSDFKNALDTLSDEVVRVRKKQWRTADELYKSQDVLSGLEEAAEIKCKEQKDLVCQLLDGMKAKDQEIKLATKEQNDLKNEQERLYQETEELFRRADNHNETLRMELQRRNGALYFLNDELERLKEKSSQELRLKENELKSAEEKMKRLKSERDQLMKETELILKRADADSEELKHALALKEHKLSEVNEDLSSLRNEKQLILLKTAEFYKRTEEGNDLMRKIIHAKDDQLDQALEQLEKMKMIQHRLVEESQNLTDQAEDNTNRMRAMLEAKEQEVKQTVLQLEKLKEDTRLLEHESKRRDADISDIEELQEKVKYKERELKFTNGQLRDLKSFLKNAAEKERKARAKLEKFIGELITRAERAESELRSLKSQSSSSFEGNAREPLESMQEVLNNTADRVQQDDKPSKPVRRKYTPAKPVRRKYKHDQKLAHDIVDLSTDSWQDKIQTTPDVDTRIRTPNENSPRRSAEQMPFYGRKQFVGEHTNVQTIIADMPAKHLESSCFDKVHYRPFGNEFRASHIRNNTYIAEANDNGIIDRSGSDTDERMRTTGGQSNLYYTKYQTEKEPIEKQSQPSDYYNLRNATLGNNTQSSDNFHHTKMVKSNLIDKSKGFEQTQTEQFAYNIPRPPQTGHHELRVPPYGHESTASMNSIPRVPPHIYNLSQRLNVQCQYDPVSAQTAAYASGPHTEQTGQPSFETNYPTQERKRLLSAHDHPSVQRFRPNTRVVTPTYSFRTVRSIQDENMCGDSNPDWHLSPKKRSDNNSHEMIQRTKPPNDWRKSEKVMYEELQEDEVDFPDELFVIPRSASEELTPELLTPEHERSQRRVIKSSNAKRKSKDDSMNETPKEVSGERPDINFDNIMDDDGIIWDVMDTLPDVSDSELDQMADRMSPSGRETIPATIQTNDFTSNKKDNKALMLPMVKPGTLENISDFKTNLSAATGDQKERLVLRNFDVDSCSSSSHVCGKSYTNIIQHGQNVADKSNEEIPNIKEFPENNPVLVTDSVGNRPIICNETCSNRLKAINRSNSGKSSSSEKDITSGGKEVYEFMTRTPILSFLGSPDNKSEVFGKTKEKPYNDDKRYHKTNPEVQSKVYTSFEEKLKGISQKYNIKRKHGEIPDEKDPMQSISDKYRQRRKVILNNLVAGYAHSPQAEMRGNSYKHAISNRSASANEFRKAHDESQSLKETLSYARPVSEITFPTNEPSIQKQKIPKGDLDYTSKELIMQGKINPESRVTENAKRNSDSETRTENEILSGDKKDTISSKPGASFQIDNFKAIIQSKHADLTFDSRVNSEAIKIDETSSAAELKECGNQPVLVNSNEILHKDDVPLDKVKEKREESKSINDVSSAPTKHVLHKMHRQTCETDDDDDDDDPETLHKQATLKGMHHASKDNIKSESHSGGFSIFAEPIDDSSSIGGDSNTQSMIDRIHYTDTDADADTDTESHYKGIMPGLGDDKDSGHKGSSLDYSDVQRMKTSRNTMSSASSQG